MESERLQLVLYPDPILKRRAEPLQTIDEEVRERVAQMFEIMYRESGVGLAAPQVGWSARLFVVNSAPEQEEEHEQVFINPVITASSDEQAIDEEGCLSIPEVRGKVARPARVSIRAQDIAGEFVELDLEGLPARVFQHELDHLNGVLFVSKLNASERLFTKKSLRRLEREYRSRDS